MNQINQALFTRPSSVDQIDNETSYINSLKLAKEYLREDQIVEAIAILKQCHKYMPNEAVQYSIADLQMQVGNYNDAVIHYSQLVKEDPEKYGFNLAKGLLKAKRYKELEKTVYNIVGYENKPEYLNLLSVMYLDLDEMDKAEEYSDKALSINPDHLLSIANKGNIYRNIGEFELALTWFQQAEEKGYVSIGLFNNIGICFDALNDQVSALSYFAKAMGEIGTPQEKFEIASNTAYSAMSLGMFDKAWQMYDLRKAVVGNVEHGYTKWQGEDLSGKNIIVRREQGIGDEIRFASVVHDIATEAANVVVECDPRLVTLFNRSFPENVKAVAATAGVNAVITDMEIHFAAHIGDLARYKRATLEDFPNHQGYLVANPDEVSHWQSYLQNFDGDLKIGISWKSANLTGMRKANYVNLSAWLPILNLPNVSFFNIYYGDAEQELKELELDYGIKIHTPTGLDLKDDQEGVAAFIQALDLVIGPPTAPIELAAAIGTSTWFMPYKSAEQRIPLYFGQNYWPWAPAVKPFFASSAQNTIEMVAEVLLDLANRDDALSALDWLSCQNQVCFK